MKPTNHLLGIALTLTAFTLLASPMAAVPIVSDGPLATGDTIEITMSDIGYSDPNASPVTAIAAGDSVRFSNFGSVPHTATDTLGGFDTGTVGVGGSRTITFGDSGVFVYECLFHPTMRGVLVVA